MSEILKEEKNNSAIIQFENRTTTLKYKFRDVVSDSDVIVNVDLIVIDI